MNLSFNLISQFSPEICSLEGLKELNLSNNKISEVPKGKCSKMCGLEILNLSSNNIEKIESIEGIQDLTGLKSLNLLSNPLLVMKQKHEKEQAMADIIKMAPHLTTFNCEEIERDEFMKPADNCSFEKENEEPKAQPSKNEFENMNSIQPTIETKPEIKPKPTEKQGDTDKGENVISIIEEEWDSEIKRLKEAGMYLTNYKRVPKYVVDQKGPDFDIKKANTYCIESGHAEIEANRVLLIFGNALEVLHREEFHECVEEIYIEYILAELLVKQSNLDQLKKFKKLKKLSISHNHLHSFIVLSKLECLSQLKILEIWNNEILKCRNLKSFVVYRFQYIESFNQHTIDDRDKKIAKMNFHVFDRLLSMELVTMPASTASKEGTKEDNKQRVRRHTDAAKAVIENLLLGCQNN